MPKLDQGTITDIEARAGCFCNTLDCEHKQGKLPGNEVFQRLIAERYRALEKAVDGWAAQCGVTVEEWCRHFTCRVEEVWPDGTGGSFTVTFRITPVWRDDAPEPPWKIKPMLVGDTYRNGRRAR